MTEDRSTLFLINSSEEGGIAYIDTRFVLIIIANASTLACAHSHAPQS